MTLYTHGLYLDGNTKEENTKKEDGPSIAPAMCLCPGSMHMVNTNKYSNEKKIRNGTQCKCKQVKLKPGAVEKLG